ncbi:MAG: cytochrome b/b6 domain-containing protein [Alphaproteobacteria bacterium]|nr:cytochrome b/b6 domain-containing protein [Alphaproteobacteria bacterium]
MSSPTPPVVRVLAWDLPTRMAKWLLVILVGLAFISHRYGDITQVWHQWNGIAILVVILFRLFWGVVGGSTARFTGFLSGPRAMITYASCLVRRKPQHFLGHNPLGGWMVIALLVAVAVQALYGLFTTDDNGGMASGPLVDRVSEATASTASVWHQNIATVVLILVGLHVAANLLYSLFGRDNLITAMITGRKPELDYVDCEEATAGSVIRALLCLFAAAVVVLGGILLAGGSLP